MGWTREGQRLVPSHLSFHRLRVWLSTLLVSCHLSLAIAVDSRACVLTPPHFHSLAPSRWSQHGFKNLLRQVMSLVLELLSAPVTHRASPALFSTACESFRALISSFPAPFQVLRAPHQLAQGPPEQLALRPSHTSACPSGLSQPLPAKIMFEILGSIIHQLFSFISIPTLIFCRAPVPSSWCAPRGTLWASRDNFHPPQWRPFSLFSFLHIEVRSASAE